MEGTSSFILQLFLVCAFVCLACGQSCPSQYHTSSKFTVCSRRNETGHWISQFRIEHGADINTLTTSPWTAEVEHNTASCNGVESVQLVATLTGSSSSSSSVGATTLAPPLRAPGYELHPGVGYYKIHSEFKTWHEARKICAQEGGHLAIINSEEESNVLQSIFAPVAATMGDKALLIGFHDLYNEGQYLTVFDEPLSSTGFYRWGDRNQPDNEHGSATHPGEDCGSIYTNGGLNDMDCSARYPFICEQELWPGETLRVAGV